METVLPTEFKRMIGWVEWGPYIIEDSHQSGTAQNQAQTPHSVAAISRPAHHRPRFCRERARARRSPGNSTRHLQLQPG